MLRHDSGRGHGVTNWVILDRKHHADRFWRAPTDFGFARALSLVPITLGETMACAANMPLVLNNAGLPFAVLRLGAAATDTVMVTRTGQWRGSHVPNALRLYPFAPAPMGKILVDADALLPDARDRLPLFDAGGGLAPDLLARLPDLQDVAADEVRTQAAAAALAASGVLRPTQHAQPSGYYTIDTDALEQAGRVTLSRLHSEGGLLLAYGVILSQANLAVLEAAERAQAAQHFVRANSTVDDFVTALARDTNRCTIPL